MLIAVGSDHRGIEYKKFVIKCLSESGLESKDFGSFSAQPVDYPDIAGSVGKAVASGQYSYGILICGTGIGMSIAANKVKGIRAALCSDDFSAERARLHNNANVICLGAERGEAGVKTLLATFFSTQFEGGRHQRRLDKISEMETSSKLTGAKPIY
jgi:ribose 5-phosphate isomerase B